MNVLIVEDNQALAQMWARHLERKGATVTIAASDETATEALESLRLDVIVLNLDLRTGGALAIYDMAEFRQPEARVVFVTASSFFSDGSIFKLCRNACAYLPSHTEPADLATMVQHYASAR